MKIFTYDNDFESLASCIYTAWEYSLAHKNEQISLQKYSDIQQNIFSEFIYVETDTDKAKKVIESIKKKLSMQCYYTVYMSFLHCEDSSNDIYNYLRLAFKHGKNIKYMLSKEIVMKLMGLQRAVTNELNSYIEIARFEEVSDNVFVSKIEPKHNILLGLADHFKNRMPSINWMIIDCARSMALIHPKDKECYIQKLYPDELEKLSATHDIRSPYKKLWKSFFDSISVKERENLKLQRQHCPIRKRKYMTEFTE
jgi:probable DNA metabolism protein